MARFFIVPVIDGQADICWETDSFRVMHYTDITDLDGTKKTVMYGEFNSGEPRDSWEEITEEEFWQVVPPEPIPEPEESMTEKLNRIETMLTSKNEELRQEGADMVTLDLIERGII